MVHSAREKLGKLYISQIIHFCGQAHFLSISNEAFLQYFVTLWQDTLFLNLFDITSLQHPLRTSGCFQTLNSYLKEFLEDPQSFPVDRVIQGGLNIYPSKYFTLQVPPSDWLHLHLDLLPPSSSHSFRSHNFSNVFQDHQERLGFLHLEMTSLWRKFHVWAAAGQLLCDLRCVIWDLGFVIVSYVTMTQLIATRNARRTAPQ